MFLYIIYKDEGENEKERDVIDASQRIGTQGDEMKWGGYARSDDRKTDDVTYLSTFQPTLSE